MNNTNEDKKGGNPLYLFDGATVAEQKRAVRRQVRDFKRHFTSVELRDKSQAVLQKLEEHSDFQAANTVLIYHSLPDEVFTHEFVLKWYDKKRILLPVVVGHELLLKFYHPAKRMHTGAYYILEPDGEHFKDFSAIDLAIVPGVAFSQVNERLGRGKGYYDRLLPKLSCKKIGICFDFQYYATLPHDTFDIPMDEIITE